MKTAIKASTKRQLIEHSSDDDETTKMTPVSSQAKITPKAKSVHFQPAY